MRKTVAFGFVGTVLDYAGRGSQRWSKWRPTLCLCQQESLVIDRLELLHDARSRSLFETLKRDIASVSPETEVVSVEIELHNPWDFEEVYACLHDFARGYEFQPEKEDYLIHITTGTHVAQICWFLLAEARYLPARLIQSSPPRKKEQPRGPGEVTIIDLDLSRYNAIASRFAEVLTFRRLARRVLAEVGGAGQFEIEPLLGEMSKMADGTMMIKYIIRNVARNLAASIREPENMEAMSAVALGSYLSGIQMAIGSCTSAHPLEHAPTRSCPTGPVLS